MTIVPYFQKPTNIPMHGAKPFIQMYKAHWKPPPTTNYWPFHRSDKLTIAKGKSVQKNIYVIQNTECLRMSEKVRKVLRRPQLVWNWFNMVLFDWKFVASPFLPSWPIKNHLGNSRILECNACNVHLSQGFLETDRSLWLSVEEDQVSEDTLPLIRLFSYVFPIPNKQKH